MMMRTLLAAGLAAALALAAPACGTADGKLALPAGFPADVPLPEGGVLRVSQDLGKKGLNLVFETENALDRAAARQRERMAAAGWRVVAEAEVEEGFFVSYRKGERAAAVGVSRGAAGAVVSVSYVALPVGGAEGDQG